MGVNKYQKLEKKRKMQDEIIKTKSAKKKKSNSKRGCQMTENKNDLFRRIRFHNKTIQLVFIDKVHIRRILAQIV